MRQFFYGFLFFTFGVLFLIFLPTAVYADEYIYSFFGNNVVTAYNLKQLEDLRNSRGGTATIPVTVRVTPEGLKQNPGLISQLESYSKNLHLQINYQVDFWDSYDPAEIPQITQALKGITTPGNTITLGVEYHFFYDFTTYPDFVREILRSGLTAPLISTNFNITNPSGPNGPNGNYMYSLEESINYLARTCPECLTSMSEIAISNYQDDAASWISELHRVRQILASVNLGLENKPLKIVEAGPDPNKGTFEERVNKAIQLANELTNYFANHPDEFKDLNISGITFLIHDAATGRIALLVMGPDGQWQVLYFFSGFGPTQFKGITLQRLNHPGPMFVFHQIIQGFFANLFGGQALVTFSHSDEQTRVIDFTPAFQKSQQAFDPLKPKEASPVFDQIQKSPEKLKVGYTYCGEDTGKPIDMKGSIWFPSQAGLDHFLGQTFYTTQQLTSRQPENLNPNREENNFQVAAFQGNPVGHAACHTDMRGPEVKEHIEDSQGESQFAGDTDLFAKILGTVEQIINNVLSVFDQVGVEVKAQSLLTSHLHQPQAEYYSHTLQSFLPKEVTASLPKDKCAITENPVKIELGIFDLTGGIQAEACAPEGEKMIESHDKTMKFLLPKELSPQYVSPWEKKN